MVSKSTFLHRDPDDLERYLLEQGRLDRAGDRARERTIAHATVAAAAGAGLTAASVTSGAGAVASAAPWTLVAKWVAVGVASGGLTVGVAEEWRHAPPVERTPSAAAVAPPSQPVAPTTPSREARASAVEIATSAEPVWAPTLAPMELTPPAPPAAATPAKSTPNGAETTAGNDKMPNEPRHSEREGAGAAGPPTAPSEPGAAEVPPAPLVQSPPPEPGARQDTTLEGELRMLDEARLALEAHAGARALAALDAYAQRFPAGGMRIESTALRIEALFALGQREQAETLARAFLATHSSSPAAMRVRLLLARNEHASKP
jgi:hypothetical protein